MDLSLVKDGVGIISNKLSEFTWEIDNFGDFYSENNKEILSPTFTTQIAERKIKWRLGLYVEYQDDYNPPSLCIFLDGDNSVSAEIKINISNNKDEITSKYLFQKKELSKMKYIKMFEKRSEQYYSSLVGRVVPDKLIISCRINIIKVNDDAFQCPERLIEFNDFETMLEDGKFSDFTFIVEEKKLHVHRAVLSCRSPVFNAMFKHGMKEKTENEMEIITIKYNVMKELLRYVYTGKVNDIKDIARNLLIAAKSYSMKNLIILCEIALFEELSVSNVLELLKLADACEATQLKAKAIKFFVSHLKNMINTGEFKLLGKLNEDLICEVVHAMALRIIK